MGFLSETFDLKFFMVSTDMKWNQENFLGTLHLTFCIMNPPNLQTTLTQFSKVCRHLFINCYKVCRTLQYRLHFPDSHKFILLKFPMCRHTSFYASMQPDNISYIITFSKFYTIYLWYLFCMFSMKIMTALTINI